MNVERQGRRMTKTTPSTLPFSSKKRRMGGAIFLGFIILLGWSLPAEAQPLGMMRSFSGELGNEAPMLQYTATGFPGRAVKGQQDKDFQMLENKVLFTVPMSQSKEHEWLLTGRMTAQSIRTQALLPSTAEAFPENLWNLGFGTAYRKRFDGGWIGGAAIDLGSASNKPYYSMDETTVSVNLFARIPHAGQNAWLLLLNYNNNREFLRHVPIPGLGYMFQKNKQYQIAIGVPFIFGEIRPWGGDFSMTFAYLPIRTVHGSVSYDVRKDLSLYGSFDWGNDEFFRAERTEKNKRLFYYEKRLTAGIRYQFNRHCFVNVGGGYAFDRMYFEGEDYSDRDFNRLDIEDGPFARVQIGLRF